MNGWFVISVVSIVSLVILNKFYGITIKSHIPVFTCFLEIFLVRRKTTHHRTIQLLVLLPVHTKQQYYKVSIIDILTVYVYVYILSYVNSSQTSENPKRKALFRGAKCMITCTCIRTYRNIAGVYTHTQCV